LVANEKKNEKTTRSLKNDDLILVTISTAKIFQSMGPHPNRSQMTLIWLCEIVLKKTLDH
jgi:hypothetical protein